MGAAYIRGFLIIFKESVTIHLEFCVTYLKLIFNKTNNMTIKMKPFQKIHSLYSSINVSETLVVYLIVSHCTEVGVRSY